MRRKGLFNGLVGSGHFFFLFSSFSFHLCCFHFAKDFLTLFFPCQCQEQRKEWGEPLPCLAHQREIPISIYPPPKKSVFVWQKTSPRCTFHRKSRSAVSTNTCFRVWHGTEAWEKTFLSGWKSCQQKTSLKKNKMCFRKWEKQQRTHSPPPPPPVLLLLLLLLFSSSSSSTSSPPEQKPPKHIRWGRRRKEQKEEEEANFHHRRGRRNRRCFHFVLFSAAAAKSS